MHSYSDQLTNLTKLMDPTLLLDNIHTMLGSLLRLRYLVELVQLVFQAHD